MSDERSSPGIRAVSMRKVGLYSIERLQDTVAVEEPLEIRLSYSFKGAGRVESAAVTMRTPGHERELALGFLLSEGVITRFAEVRDIRILGSGGSNEILVELDPSVDVESWHLRRATLLNSACGLCGKTTIESIPYLNQPEEAGTAHRSGEPFQVQARAIRRLPQALRDRQSGFNRTGGLHAAAVASAGGELDAVFEDIGRHNALDKLIGHCLLHGRLPLSCSILFMSSRGSFELVQKCDAAGCPMLATIGAPSSLAIEFARDRGITLIGFVRDDHFNVYSAEWRVVL